MNVKIQKCHPDAKIPKYESEGAAGFDLSSVETLVVLPGSRCLVKTGLKMEIPKGFELQIRPRSGNALKYGITVLNSPGTIDSDYRGEIGVIVYNTDSYNFAISAGDRIAQGVIAPIEQVTFEEVTELGNTERGAGGFGSTGK